ncbi:PREDICTED: myosin heavy chain, cardiac muscle isoform-like [Branchiostoma belcheri]|uniref:Myosin heavy chain, cardiac muscle isoform-like n=1 Tax=Branchiostoma belcheri TaxID=7741 RepID=A0A6P4Z1B5_BRABE|nr:PREDICTED: myosin heavy chain, cardiac muscle isoform-like [Branchiostoma belcheri]
MLLLRNNGQGKELKISGALAESEIANNNLLYQMAQLGSEQESLKDIRVELEAEKDQLADELTQLKSRLLDSNQIEQNAGVELKRLSDESRQLETEKTKVMYELTQVKIDYESLKEEVGNLNSRLQKSQANANELEVKLERVTEDYTNLSNSYEKMVSESSSIETELQKNRKALLTQTQDQASEIDVLHDRVKELEEEINKLQDGKVRLSRGGDGLTGIPQRNLRQKMQN